MHIQPHQQRLCPRLPPHAAFHWLLSPSSPLPPDLTCSQNVPDNAKPGDKANIRLQMQIPESWKRGQRTCTVAIPSDFDIVCTLSPANSHSSRFFLTAHRTPYSARLCQIDSAVCCVAAYTTMPSTSEPPIHCTSTQQYSSFGAWQHTGQRQFLHQ